MFWVTHLYYGKIWRGPITRPDRHDTIRSCRAASSRIKISQIRVIMTIDLIASKNTEICLVLFVNYMYVFYICHTTVWGSWWQWWWWLLSRRSRRLPGWPGRSCTGRWCRSRCRTCTPENRILFNFWLKFGSKLQTQILEICCKHQILRFIKSRSLRKFLK